mgnify:CR=1 FL=1
MFSKNIAITDTTDGLPNPRRIWAVIAASLALIMSVLDAKYCQCSTSDSFA